MYMIIIYKISVKNSALCEYLIWRKTIFGPINLKIGWDESQMYTLSFRTIVACQNTKMYSIHLIRINDFCILII